MMRLLGVTGATGTGSIRAFQVSPLARVFKPALKGGSSAVIAARVVCNARPGTRTFIDFFVTNGVSQVGVGASQPRTGVTGGVAEAGQGVGGMVAYTSLICCLLCPTWHALGSGSTVPFPSLYLPV